MIHTTALRARTTTAAVRAFAAAAAAAWPAEACGLLGGRRCGGDFAVRTFLPLRNHSRDDGAFAVDAVEFAAGEARLRAAGRALVGFAHSHPGGAALPSARDRRELWRDCLQWIGAVDRGGGFELAAFVLTAATVQTVILEHGAP
jgi:proteasome lid subunit RPN8/RPN11